MNERTSETLENCVKVIKMHSLVNVPMTLPSSFLATESHSWAAMSAATFFAERGKKKEKKEKRQRIVKKIKLEVQVI